MPTGTARDIPEIEPNCYRILPSKDRHIGGWISPGYPVQRHPQENGDRSVFLLAWGGEPYYTAFVLETAHLL